MRHNLQLSLVGFSVSSVALYMVLRITNRDPLFLPAQLFLGAFAVPVLVYFCRDLSTAAIYLKRHFIDKKLILSTFLLCTILYFAILFTLAESAEWTLLDDHFKLLWTACVDFWNKIGTLLLEQTVDPKDSVYSRDPWKLNLPWIALLCIILLPFLLDAGIKFKSNELEIEIEKDEIDRIVTQANLALCDEDDHLYVIDKIYSYQFDSDWSIRILNVISCDRIIGIARALATLYYSIQNLIWLGKTIQRQREYLSIDEMLDILRDRGDLSAAKSNSLKEVTRIAHKVLNGTDISHRNAIALGEVIIQFVRHINDLYIESGENLPESISEKFLYSKESQIKNRTSQADAKGVVDLLDGRYGSGESPEILERVIFIENSKLEHSNEINFKEPKDLQKYLNLKPVSERVEENNIVLNWIQRFPLSLTLVIIVLLVGIQSIVLSTFITDSRLDSITWSQAFSLAMGGELRAADIVAWLSLLIFFLAYLGVTNSEILIANFKCYVINEWRRIVRQHYYGLVSIIILLMIVAHAPTCSGLPVEMRDTAMQANVLPLSYTDLFIVFIMLLAPYADKFNSVKFKQFEFALPKSEYPSLKTKGLSSESWEESLERFVAFNRGIGLSRLWGTLYSSLQVLNESHPNAKAINNPKELITHLSYSENKVRLEKSNILDTLSKLFLAIHHPYAHDRKSIDKTIREGADKIRFLNDLHLDKKSGDYIVHTEKTEANYRKGQFDYYQVETISFNKEQLQNNNYLLQSKIYILDLKGLIDLIELRGTKEEVVKKAILIDYDRHLFVSDESGNYLTTRSHSLNLNRGAKVNDERTNLDDSTDLSRNEYCRETSVAGHSNSNKALDIDIGTQKGVYIYIPGILYSEGYLLKQLTRQFNQFKNLDLFPAVLLWQGGYWNVLSKRLKLAKNEALAELSKYPVNITPGHAHIPDLEQTREAIDRSIEFAFRNRDGRKRWTEIKKVANNAVSEERGICNLLAEAFQTRQMTIKDSFEVNLICHSAGAFLLCSFVKQLTKKGIEVDNCFLIAPACSIELFEKNVVSAMRINRVRRTFIFALRDQFEREDNCCSIYNKSFLYLLSSGIDIQNERLVNAPLLGMQKFQSRHLEGWSDLIQSGRLQIITCPEVDENGFAIRSAGESHIELAHDNETLYTIANEIRKGRVDGKFL